MTLQEILFKGYVVPEAPTTFKHESCFSGEKQRYVPPPKAPRPRDNLGRIGKQARDAEGFTELERRIYNLVVEAGRPVSPIDIKMDCTQNHISHKLSELYQLGKLKRTKIVSGRRRFYLYEVKHG